MILPTQTRAEVLVFSAASAKLADDGVHVTEIGGVPLEFALAEEELGAATAAAVKRLLHEIADGDVHERDAGNAAVGAAFFAGLLELVPADDVALRAHRRATNTCGVQITFSGRLWLRSAR